MLVLSRTINESVMIGDDTEVTIVSVKGAKVRVGISAPKHIPVYRREIYDRILQGRRQGQEVQEGTGPPTENTL